MFIHQTVRRNRSEFKIRLQRKEKVELSSLLAVRLECEKEAKETKIQFSLVH